MVTTETVKQVLALGVIRSLELTEVVGIGRQRATRTLMPQIVMPVSDVRWSWVVFISADGLPVGAGQGTEEFQGDVAG